MSAPVARVRAPGKLVLVGEYAVLDGAGAIVAAIDRGVRCEVWTPTPAAPAGIVTPGDDRYVRAALARATPEHAPDRWRYVFADDRPTGLPDKPGFGGSAAATVAACVAARLDQAVAVEVHAAVQGGGSGVDVFAAAHGGVRRFPDGTEVPCPPLLAVYSGKSAQTGPRVQAYRAWAARAPGAHAAFVRESRALLHAFQASPLEALASGYALLRAMAAAAGLDYDTPALARIAELARAHGGAAKPSGAGGGDVAVAAFGDVEARDAFARACAREGMPPIPVAVAPAASVEVAPLSPVTGR